MQYQFVKHQFCISLVDLVAYLPQVFFQVICNYQRFIQVQHIVKSCLVFGIKDVVAVSQQYPARALDYLMLVHVFLCMSQLAAQLVYGYVSEFRKVRAAILLLQELRMSALPFCEIYILVLYAATIRTFDTLNLHLDKSL